MGRAVPTPTKNLRTSTIDQYTPLRSVQEVYYTVCLATGTVTRERSK